MSVDIKNIPQSPGVYIMKNINGNVIYVGKAKNLKKRVSQYFSGKNQGVKTEHLVSKIHGIETIVSGNELEAFLLENTLIKQYKPKYNISLKDDKSYPYIKISASKTGFPYIYKTRNLKKGDGEYFGPYSSAFAVSETVRTVNSIFKMRTCTDGKFNSCSVNRKPCLYYQIKRCSAPCCGNIDSESYKKNVEAIRLLLSGKNRQLIKEIKRSMNECARRLDFEGALKLRDRVNAIIKINEKQAVVLKEEKDIDAVGFYSKSDKLDVVVLVIRNGRLTGTKNFFFKNVYLNDKEMLSAFLSRFYAKNLETNADIPTEILIPLKIEEDDKNAIAGYIKRFSSKKAKILAPESIKRNRDRYETIAAMASENAKKNFFEKTTGGLPDLSLQEGQEEERKQEVRGKREEEEKLCERNEIKILIKLQKILGLKKIPEVIECFDISNISGTYAVASKAVFRSGKKDPASYRRYRIRSKNTPDDYAMMYEALSRRFDNAVNGKDPLPDVIMVDGGKGQLNVLAGTAKNFTGKGFINQEHMPALIAIAKSKGGKNLKDANAKSAKNIKVTKDFQNAFDKGGISPAYYSEIDKIYLSGRKNEVNFAKNKDAVFMLMRLRDEAHRFAVSYFSKVKTKSLITSELLNINGVGKIIYGSLINNLGSVDNIKKASMDELAAVKGVRKKTAEKIYDYFHKTKK